MGKSVAVDGEVKTTVGTTLLTATGTWKAGEISYSTYDKLKVSGVKVMDLFNMFQILILAYELNDFI